MPGGPEDWFRPSSGDAVAPDGARSSASPEAATTSSALPPELDPHGSSRRSRKGGGGGSRTSVATRLSAVAAVAVLLVSGGGWAAVSRYLDVDKVDAGTTSGGSVDRTDQMILVVGSDNRSGLTDEQVKEYHLGFATQENASGQRSDTMMLVHVSKERDEVTVVSLPRDSLVTIPAYKDDDGEQHAAQKQKLNAAYSLGGAKLLVKTVEAATGVHIDHYVEVSFAGFLTMVEAVGTVTVCSPTAVDDEKSGLVLTEGKNKLGPKQALAYVRARYAFARADLDRIDNQQQFIGALFRAATSKGVLLNPIKINALLSAVSDSLTVDKGLSKNDMLDLAQRVRDVGFSDIQFATVPIADGNHDDPQLGSTVLWNDTKAQLLFQRLEADEPINPKAAASASPSASASGGDSSAPTVAPGEISVQVLNGTTTSGLARTTSDELAAFGYAVEEPGNAETTDTTEIRYDPAWDESLKTVLATFPGATAVPVEGQGKVFVVTVGADFTETTRPVVTEPSGSASASATPKPEKAVDTTTAKAKRCT